MLKHLSGFFIVLVCFCQLTLVHAGVQEDYYEARETYICASACLATYDDYIGRIARDALQDTGWRVAHYRQLGDKADVRFLTASKEIDGEKVYLVAANGTEREKDLLTDIMFDKVYFSGQTPEELVANSEKKVLASEPMIHRGFYHYVRTALQVKSSSEKGQSEDFLFEELIKHPKRKIYLVGHSLGGAAVTVSAAALINFGVHPDQMKVITFGAPAVGNEAFRSKYESQINLKRFVMRGDAVTGVLQGLVGGYVQMGKQVDWPVQEDFNYSPHSIALYLDKATKEYYQKRQLALNAGVISAANKVLPTEENQPFVYVAPVANELPEALHGEFYYMKEALLGKYRKMFPAYILEEEEAKDATTDAALKIAAAAGCKWLVIPEIQGRKLTTDKNAYYIVFQQTVYRVADGQLITMETYSSGTQKLTPIEVVIHGGLEMSLQKAPWLQ